MNARGGWILAAAVSSFLCLGMKAPSDDTTAFQAQVNDAIIHHRRIVMQSRVYRLSSSVSFAPRSGKAVVSMTVEGTGVGNTVVEWTGPPDQSVFVFRGAKLGSVSGIYFKGRPAFADLDFRGNGSSGSMEIAHVYFDNVTRFSVRLGNPKDASQVSEFSFKDVTSNGSTGAGFQIEGNNSLNEEFYNCGCSHEPVCVSNSPVLEPGAQTGGNSLTGSVGASALPRSAGLIRSTQHFC
jgi:hypothetical protein